MEANQPTEEQIKEFWKWFGFKPITHEQFYPAFTTNHLDLNNLFKYAVPKLESVQLAKFADTRWHAIVQKKILKDVVGDDPALALFWAIWEVMHATT